MHLDFFTNNLYLSKIDFTGGR